MGDARYNTNPLGLGGRPWPKHSTPSPNNFHCASPPLPSPLPPPIPHTPSPVSRLGPPSLSFAVFKLPLQTGDPSFDTPLQSEIDDLAGGQV